MLTEKITVSNSGAGMEDALSLAERTAASMGLGRRESFHLRLLTEETLGMMRAIVGEFSASFWLEEEDRTFKLHLKAKADVNYPRRRELLSVSTQGRNIAPRGIMEKVRELIEAGLYGMDEILELQAECGGTALNYGLLGAMDMGMSEAMYSWSMRKYKDSVASSKDADNPLAVEAWDELEKSIVANIADEVQVGVTKDSVELIIIKNFSKEDGGGKNEN